jgi:phosphatidylserine/phosphatidylglycerophosphate/cardiolipin synthase-like enzyme
MKLADSALKAHYDQTNFYRQFLRDLSLAREYIVIESPFMTVSRWEKLYTPLQQLKDRGVSIIVNTKPTNELSLPMSQQATLITKEMQSLGIIVLHTIGHHRKLAIIDGQISWEGSLNILSQYDSCEIMRRTCSDQETLELVNFLGLSQYITHT